MIWDDKIDGIVEKAVEEAVAEVLESKDAELKNKDGELKNKDIELRKQAEEIISLRKQLVESKNAK